MKFKFRRKKRVTFIRLLASFFSVAVLVSLVFANLFHEILIRNIRNELCNELMTKMSEIQSKVSQLNETSKNSIKQLDAFMSSHTYYAIFTNRIEVNSGWDENCYAVSAIIDDETNTVVASNKQKLVTFLKLRDDEKGSMYGCDREVFNIPQLDEFFDNYSDCCYNIHFNSVYVNEDDYSFVPHSIIIENVDYHSDDVDDVLMQPEIIDTKEIVIDFDDEKYQLVDLNKSSENKVPYAFISGFYGCDIFDYTALTNSNFSDASSWFYDDNLLNVHGTNTVYIEGKPYTLRMLFVLDKNCESISKFY